MIEARPGHAGLNAPLLLVLDPSGLKIKVDVFRWAHTH